MLEKKRSEMKNKLETIMYKPYFMIIVLAMFFFVWSFKFFIPYEHLLQTTFIAYIPLALMFALILIFFENTVHTFIFLLGFIFSVGYGNINLDTISNLTYALIAFGILILGMVIHLIKYPFKFKWTWLIISFMLITISFYIPLLYKSFEVESLFIASLGLFYLILVIFYSVTLKKTSLNHLMRIMLITLLFLSLELLTLILKQMLTLEGDIISRYQQMLGIGFDVGWSNVNDLTILMVLFSSSLFYYMIKYPKNIFPFLGIGFVSLLIILSFSRGSMITITAFVLIILGYILFSKNKHLYFNLLISLIIASVIIYVQFDFIKTFLELVFDNLDDSPEGLLTGRVTLWKHAIETFKTYPVFGSGWHTPLNILNPGENRITIFHSTFFQVLATGGIFGMLVLGFHLFVVYKLFRNIRSKTILWPILVTYVLTQIHGLIDNTQYMVFYTISTLTIFLMIQNQEQDVLLNHQLNPYKQ